MKALLLAAAFGLAPLSTAFATDTALPAPIAAAIASSRPKTDTDRDALRKPGPLMAFAGIAPGQQIGDLMPGQGYFTRLFSRVAGPQGHVYALIPSELAAVAPKIPDAMKTLAADPAYPNVTSIIAPTAQIGAPVKLDIIWTSQNYHDVYGFFGAPAAAALDAAVFKALKPGGAFLVIDHVANAGTNDSGPKTLHRIDPETVKAQVLAAGFTLEATSDLLLNTADPHTVKVFAPEIRGHTDQFVFKFRKPL